MEFLLALRDVVEAHGGVGQLAKVAKLNRESLYKLLSKDGNPRLSSLESRQHPGRFGNGIPIRAES